MLIRQGRVVRLRKRNEKKRDPFSAVEADTQADAKVLAASAESDTILHDFEAAEKAFSRKVPLAVKVAIVVALVAIFVLSFSLGQYPIPPAELVQTLYVKISVELYNLFTGSDIELTGAAFNALFSIRLPRICVVMLVGAALSVAGAAYQGMFKNPLVSPDLLGASAGASFGACLALLFDMPSYMVQLLAFCGGMVAVGGAVWLNRIVKSDAILGLVLGGILVSTLFESGTSLIKFMADADDKLPAITYWLMGSFADVNSKDLSVVALPMIGGFVILLLESWKLNVLSFGDEEARALGINTRRVRLIVIFASTLVVSCSVAVSGIVGWVGLVIPHLARAIVGPNYKVLLPTSMLLGAGYLLIVDNIARLAMTVEIPIGILTAILGVPFFVFIFRRNNKGW